MSIKHLFLLSSLLLGSVATLPSWGFNSDASSAVQPADEETRAVTLDITGMT